MFTEDLPPCLGGIAQWALGVAESLSKLGHDVHIYMRKTPLQNDHSYENKNYTVHLMADRKWTKRRSIYIAYYTIKSLFKSPDLIIATVWNIGSFATLLGRFFSFKTAMVYHGLEVTKSLSRKRLNKLKNTLSRASLNIAVSRFTKEAIDQRFNQDFSVQIIHNGLDLYRFYPQKKSATLLEKYEMTGKKVLLTLARVIERKGHDTVIDAMKTLLKSYPDCMYLIAGGYNKAYKQKLEEQINRLDLDESVKFTGFIPDEEINAYYNCADVYIMLSKDSNQSGDTEGFGITFLEANACEKPVIGSNCHGIPDAIEEGYSGFLIEPDSPDLLVEKVKELLDDSDYANKIGKQGRQRIEAGFTWDIVAQKIISAVEDNE